MFAFQTPLALFIAVPMLYLWWRLARGPRNVWGVRILIILLCAALCASPRYWKPQGGRRIVFLVDRSLSVGNKAAEKAEEMLDLARAEKEPADEISVVTFGRGARFVGESVGQELISQSLQDASDLYAGLNLANGLLSRSGGQIVTVSDGRYTGKDPMALVPEFHKSGARILTSPLHTQRKRDVAITEVHTPERVARSTPYQVAFSVSSPVSCKSSIQIKRPGRTIKREVEIEEGHNRFAFRDAIGQPGLVRYRVSVPVKDDGEPQNNHAEAVTQVMGAPRMLLVTPTGRPGMLGRALQKAGIRVRIVGPHTDMSSAALKAFDAVVLENVALSSFGGMADAALRNYVVETGGGLLVTGGKNSFAAGGYYKSKLEPILPVSMERKEEYRRPPVAMGIVLDRSGSMSAPVDSGMQKMDLANRAAAEAVNLLAPQDEVAAFAVDSEAHEVIGLTGIEGNRGEVESRILSVESRGGGIYVHNGLKAAMGELMDSEANTRHIVLFADAADSEQKKGVRKMVGQWRKAGGTISVIGLGTAKDKDATFLKKVARKGGGKVFLTNDARALPRIFCEDAMRIARKTFIENAAPTEIGPGVHLLGELGIRAFPNIGGYNLCYRRKEAELIVRTTDEHNAPVCAAWQRGLGRVAALTCEVDGKYTGQLAEWDGYKTFMTAVVRWIRRSRDDVSLFGTIVRQGRRATIQLEMDEEFARRCRGAHANIIPPDESEAKEIPLQWVSGRRMRGEFKLGSDGVYHGVVTTRSGKQVSLPPVVLPYSPEFERPAEDRGEQVLGELTEVTDGDALMQVEDLFTGDAGMTKRSASVSLAPWGAVLMLILILCDIATRRGLWGVLLPAGLRKLSSRLSERVTAVVSRLRERDVRESTGRAASESSEAGEEGDEEDEEPEEEEDGENVFDKAKRRWR